MDVSSPRERVLVQRAAAYGREVGVALLCHIPHVAFRPSIPTGSETCTRTCD